MFIPTVTTVEIEGLKMYEDNPKNHLWKICTICDVPVMIIVVLNVTLPKRSLTV